MNLASERPLAPEVRSPVVAVPGLRSAFTDQPTGLNLVTSGLSSTGRRTRRARTTLLFLVGLMLIAAVFALGSGALRISPTQVLAILADRIGWHLSTSYEPQQATVFWLLRVPRVLTAFLIGGGLALSGAAMQGLFRNPLADPALIGVSSGAAVGAVAAIVAAGKIAALNLPGALPACGFFGALGATLLVHWLGKTETGTSVTHLLLAGIAVNAFCMAGVGLITFQATDAQLRSITFWNLGSLGGSSWPALSILGPLIVVPALFLRRQTRFLNALLLGEAEAGHLGFSVEAGKRLVLVCVAIIVGAAVSVAGIIGFVGLVAPHLLRLVLGADHRWLLPGSATLGALLLLLADTFCRTAAAPAEIPVGVVTALIGAPFFVWLLWRERRTA